MYSVLSNYVLIGLNVMEVRFVVLTTIESALHLLLLSIHTYL